MSYKFTPYRVIREYYLGVSIGQHMYISSSAFYKMGEPKYIKLEMDEKNKALRIVTYAKREKGCLKVSLANKNFNHSGSVGATFKTMQKGRYYLVSAKKNEFIFQK